MGVVNSTTTATTQSASSSVPESYFTRKMFNESYDLGNKLGSGSFASVHECFRKSDSVQFAVKIIKKTYLTNKELICLRDEIHILKRTSHRNIIKLIDTFDDGDMVYMVLELCDDKDLFDAIVSTKNKRFTEQQSAIIIYSIANALEYLHENRVIHRDLKPENILFGNDGAIKITDFGLAHHESNIPCDVSEDCDEVSYDSIWMNTCCGTPHYVAPEIITRNEYNYKCDVWSLGVILYIMLVGYQPFNGETLNEIYESIVDAKYNFNTKRWDGVSSEAKDLIQRLLVVDPLKRYGIKELKCHKWIRKYHC